jgi:hypothetical protein
MIVSSRQLHTHQASMSYVAVSITWLRTLRPSVRLLPGAP